MMKSEASPSSQTTNKQSYLTRCPVCQEEFYMVVSGSESSSEVNVTCPSCHTFLEVKLDEGQTTADTKLAAIASGGTALPQRTGSVAEKPKASDSKQAKK